MCRTSIAFSNTSHGVRAMAVFVALALTPSRSPGQAITGRVLDAATDSAVEGVAITLVDSAGTTVSEVYSTGAGLFSLAPKEAGRYTIQAERLGYGKAVSPGIHVGAADTIRVELRISTEAIGLAPLTVVARRPSEDPRLAGWGFYDRKERYRGRGRAVFYTSEELDETEAFRITDLIRELPELQLVRDGHHTYVVKRRSWRQVVPVPVFLDGHPLRLGQGESIDGYVSLSSVGAIEIYWRHAPAQYGGDAAIVLWTGRF